MLDFIRHLFGVCGDGHPSILFGFGLMPILLAFRVRITLYVKILSQRFGLGFRQDKIQS